jgi:hypothetical protein
LFQEAHYEAVFGPDQLSFGGFLMKKPFRAGASKIVITPPVGFRLSGYEDRIQGSVGVHDELYARALVVDDGAEKAAIVSCDMIALPKELVKEVRTEVEKNLEINGDSIIPSSLSGSGR